MCKVAPFRMGFITIKYVELIAGELNKYDFGGKPSR